MNPADTVMHQIMSHIERVGWSVIGTVTPDGTPFAYTVGLTLQHLPELHIEGPEADGGLLSELARRQTQAGPYKPGQITQVDDHVMRLEDLADLTALVWARRFFDDGVPAMPTALTVYILTAPTESRP